MVEPLWNIAYQLPKFAKRWNLCMYLPISDQYLRDITVSSLVCSVNIPWSITDSSSATREVAPLSTRVYRSVSYEKQITHDQKSNATTEDPCQISPVAFNVVSKCLDGRFSFAAEVLETLEHVV